MRRVAGFILAGLGAFLIVTALMLKFYAVPALAKAPLSPGEDNPDGITVTKNVGTATALFSPANLAAGEDPIRRDVALTSTRNTRGDVQAAQTSEAKDQGLAVYDSFSRLVDSEGTVVNADTLRVAFDRVTSELKNCCGANYNGDTVTFEGINPLKFPMFTEKKTYQYFDTTLAKAWPAEFTGEEQMAGGTVYKFVMNIPETKVGTQDLPGSLVGSDEPTVTTDAMYANVRTLWVEPTTGSIVKGQEQQSQFFQAPSGLTVPKIEATIGAPDDEVAKSMASALDSAGLIKTLGSTVPVGAGILGVVALGAGIALGVLGARRDEDRVAGAEYV